MEPLVELYLERTEVGQTTVLFSDDIQQPFEGHYILMTEEENKQLGCPKVVYVSVTPFLGDTDG
jgi:hypothetical protein